jgi:hypothetical protein
MSVKTSALGFHTAGLFSDQKVDKASCNMYVSVSRLTRHRLNKK